MKGRLTDQQLLKYLEGDLNNEELRNIEEILQNSEEDQKRLEDLQEILFFENLGETLPFSEIQKIIKKVLLPKYQFRFQLDIKNRIIEFWNVMEKQTQIHQPEMVFRSQESSHLTFEHTIEGRRIFFIFTFSEESDELYLSIVDQSKMPYSVHLYHLESESNIVPMETLENIQKKSMFETPLHKKGMYRLEFILPEDSSRSFLIDFYLDTK